MPFEFCSGGIRFIPEDVKIRREELVLIKAFGIEAIKRVVAAQYDREGKDGLKYCQDIDVAIESRKSVCGYLI